MILTNAEYHFIEWLVTAKGVTTEDYKALTPDQLKRLKREWLAKCQAIVVLN